jgi:hypothetical protein
MEIDSSILHVMLGLLFTGFLLMGVGFSFRDHNWGIALLTLGSFTMLGTIGYRMYLALH